MFTFPKKVKQERLSVSLADYVVDWVRETAKKNDTTISAVVEYAIRQMKNRETEQEMIKGLLEDAADPAIDAENQEWMNAPMGRK